MCIYINFLNKIKNSNTISVNFIKYMTVYHVRNNNVALVLNKQIIKGILNSSFPIVVSCKNERKLISDK